MIKKFLTWEHLNEYDFSTGKSMFFGLLIILFFSGKVKSQVFCLTEKSDKNAELEEFYNSTIKSTKAANTYCLRIYVHVLRRSDGTGGQSWLGVIAALRYLDMDFNPHGIYFQWDQSIDFIDDDRYFNPDHTNILKVNNHVDGIDVYLADDSLLDYGEADGLGESSGFYIMGSAVRSHLISHEMGHVLFLHHTHAQDEQGCKEYVDGRNTSQCGDFVSDTPPDPGMYSNVDVSDCEWDEYDNGNSNHYDPEGVPYDPDETNIMSYTNIQCMTGFTQGQGTRMRNAIATLPHLISATVDCGSNGCSNNLVIHEDVTVGTTQIQQAVISITAYNTIEKSASVQYLAGQQINLTPGFRSELGAIFNGKVQTCSKSLNATLKSDFPKEVFDNEAFQNNVIAYPNKAYEKVSIILDYNNEEGYKVSVHDNTGQLIKTENITSSITEISLSGFQEGIYFIKIYNSSNVLKTIKIIHKN